MLKNDISAIEEQFKRDCIIIDLRKEYPEKVGEEILKGVFICRQQVI